MSLLYSWQPLRLVKRAVALDCDAVAVAALRVIVPHRVVQGAAIVPERDRVRLPAEAAVEFRRLGVAVQHLQEGVAFEAAQALDRGGEVRVDEQRLAAGDRV